MDQDQMRLACLELATKIAVQTGNTEALITDAERMMQWMRGSHDAQKTPDYRPSRNEDDIPF